MTTVVLYPSDLVVENFKIGQKHASTLSGPTFYDLHKINKGGDGTGDQKIRMPSTDLGVDTPPLSPSEYLKILRQYLLLFITHTLNYIQGSKLSFIRFSYLICKISIIYHFGY